MEGTRKQRPKREPEVIIFQEPTHKKRFKRERSNRQEPAPVQRHDYEERKVQLENDGLNFKETYREMRGLAASSLEGKDKKRDEEEYLKSLGAKECKPVKMPYPMYMSMVKKQRKADQKKQDMVAFEETYGNQKKSKRGRDRSKAIRGRGRWQDRVTSLEPSIGKFKGGIWKLSSKDVKKLKQNSK